MAKRTYEFEIEAKIDAAIAAIDKLTKTTEEKANKINFNTAVSAFVDGFHLIEEAAREVFGHISGFINESIAAAAEAEQGQVKLANAMRLTGDFSEGAAESFRNLGDEIARTTTISEDEVIAAASMAKNFQLTNTEAQKLIKVSADLAAVTGQSLTSAVSELGATFSGVINRDLSKFAPVLKSLTLEQKASGDAIAIIGERVKGSAAALTDTFGGSIKQVTNLFQQFQEELGNLIVKNPVIVQGIKVIGQAIKELTDSFKGNEGQFGEIITASFKSIIGLTPSVISAFKGIDFIVSNTVITFISLGRAIGAIAASLVALASGSLQEAGNQIKEVFGSLQEDVLKDFSTNSDRISGFYDPIIAAATKAADNINKIQVDSVKKQKNNFKTLTDDQIKSVRTTEVLAQELPKRIADALKSPIALIITPRVEADLSKALTGTEKVFTAAAVGFLSQITKGAAGAKTLVSGAIGAAADAFVPGIGGAVSQIAEVLADGPDKVRETVKAFTDSIPSIITNIVESIPVLIEELAKALPEIIKKLADAAPEIINAIIRSLPDITAALVAQMPLISIALTEALIKDLPKIVESFAKSFLEIPEQFLNKLLELIPGGKALAGKSGGSFLDSIPVVGSIASGIGNLFGFAEGGTTPRSARLENDGGLARIGANETVIDSELTDWLRQMKASGSLTKQPDIVVNIGHQEFARIMFDVNKAGYRTS